MCIHKTDNSIATAKNDTWAGARVHFYHSDGFPFANYFEIQLAAQYDVFDSALCNKNS